MSDKDGTEGRTPDHNIELSDAERVDNVKRFVTKHLPMYMGVATLTAMEGGDQDELGKMLENLKK